MFFILLITSYFALDVLVVWFLWMFLPDNSRGKIRLLMDNWSK